MKKITLLKSVLRLFVVTLFVCSTVYLQSCKDAMLEPEKVEISKIDPIQEGSVILKENRLVFSSGKFVEKYIDDLKKGQTDEINKSYNVNVKGFKSMQEKYDELISYGIGEAIKDGSIENYKDVLEITTDEKGRKDFKIAVRNHLLSSIISEKGLIQIGSDVYKIENGNAYKVKEKDIQELFSSDIKQSSKVSLINFNTNSKSNKQAKVNGEIGEEKYKEYIAFPGAANRRFCTRIDIYRGFWAQTIYGEFSVMHQRDNWYGWGRLATGTWNYTYGGSYTFKCPTDPNPSTTNWSNRNIINYPSADYIWDDREGRPLFGIEDLVTNTSVNVSGTWSSFGNDGQPYNDDYNKTGTW